MNELLIICTLSNSLFITDMEGKEIANLHSLSSVVQEESNNIALVTVLDDGGMASWTYDDDHEFRFMTRYNTLLGPVIEYIETDKYSFAISTKSKSNAYKEILTQYQRNDCDSEWEAYDYNESTDSKGAIDLTDALMKHSARQPKAANAAFQPAQHGAVLSSTQK